MNAVYTDTQQNKLRCLIPDLIRSRELLLDLVSKELRARYRNAMMGFLWAVLQPLLMMLILTFVFTLVFANRAADRGVATDHVPFAVFLLCGLVPWQFLAAALSTATTSLVDNHELIKKVYFPREVIPLAAVLNRVVNFLIGFALLIAVRTVMMGLPGVGMLYVPFIFAVQLTLIVGVALLFSCLNVYFRDVAYSVEVLLTFGFYASPVFYGLSNVQDLGAAHPWLYRLYMLNPMAGIITAYRDAFLHNRVPDGALLLWPMALAAGMLAVGLVVFRRHAPVMADHL